MSSKLEFVRKINLIQFIYLNRFCRNIVRNGKGKIIPYKNAVIDLAADAKIILKDGDLEVGAEKLKKSKTETYIRLRSGAKWNVRENCTINYGCCIEVLKDALLETDYFTMNTRSVLIAADQITLGHDVMIGRNAVIYDSDFHPIVDAENHILNPSKPVSIGNHVWLGTGSMVLKGVTIGDNAIIAAGEIVRNSVEADTTAAAGQRMKNKGEWRRR